MNMKMSCVVLVIGRLALGLTLASMLAAAEPKPLEPDEVARAEEALRQLTDEEHPVPIPDSLEALLMVIGRQLDDAQAYLQVEMGGRAGQAFLAAQRALTVLDERLDDELRAAVSERLVLMRRRLDALAVRLLQDGALVPVDLDPMDGLEQPDVDPADADEPLILDDELSDVVSEPAVPDDPDTDPDQDAADAVTEDAVTEDAAADLPREPSLPEADDQEH